MWICPLCQRKTPFEDMMLARDGVHHACLRCAGGRRNARRVDDLDWFRAIEADVLAEATTQGLE
ncbi:MAG: hypothetical protein ACYDCQ_14385 [Dehalococcoidia bacterium]